MPTSCSKRRAAVTSGLLLALVTLTVLSSLGLALQPKIKPEPTKPAAQKPAPDKPTTEKPTAVKPATAKLQTEQPAPAKPAAEKIGAPKSTTAAVPAFDFRAIEKLHPAKPIFLYIWDGSQAHQKSWDATGFQKALVGSGLYQSISKLLSFFIESTDPNQALMSEFAARAIVNGASISVTVETIADQPAVRITLVLCNSADQTQKLAELFDQFGDGITREVETISDRKVNRFATPFLEGYEIGWWTEGDHVVIVGGMQAIETSISIVTGKTPNLSSNPTVQKLRKSDDFDVASISFIDFKTITNLVENVDIPPIPGSDKAPVKVRDILQIVGIDKLGLLTERWGFKDEAIWTESDLEAAAPLTGLMTILDQKPLTLKDLPALPASCEYFLLARHDFSKSFGSLIDVAEKIAEKIAPADAPPVSDALKNIGDLLGVDLKSELMEPLGDTFSLYVEGAGIFPAAVILIKLDDAKKVFSTLETLEAKLKEISTGITPVEFRERATLGRTLHLIQNPELPLVNPTWVVDQDWLVIGTTSQAVEAYLKRVDGKLPKWKPTAEVTAALKMLPDQFATLYYCDPRGALKYGLGLAPTGIAILEQESAARIRHVKDARGEKREPIAFPISPEDVPVTEEITGPLFPSIGTCTVDAKGIHWRNRNSTPGLPVPGIPGGTGGVSGLFTAIMPSTALFSLRSSAVLVAPPAVRDAN
jgi:hypothetical protein